MKEIHIFYFFVVVVLNSAFFFFLDAVKLSEVHMWADYVFVASSTNWNVCNAEIYF